MKVHELITMLQALPNQDATVLVHANEDFSHARGLDLKDSAVDEDDGLYCKGCSYEEFVAAQPDLDFVVLHDEQDF